MNNRSNIGVELYPNKCPKCGQYSATLSNMRCQHCGFEFYTNIDDFYECKFIFTEIGSQNKLELLRNLHQTFDIGIIELKRKMESFPFVISKKINKQQLEQIEKALKQFDVKFNIEKTQKIKFRNINYSEKLKTGGILEIKEDAWCIKYYYPGPDLRYNGNYIVVRDSEVENYIQAWKNNFTRYMELKNSMSNQGELIANGEQGMKIVISNYYGGVYLQYPTIVKKPWVYTQDTLDNIINDYIYAQKRVTEIRNEYTL